MSTHQNAEVKTELLNMLDQVLSLKGRALSFDEETLLLGSLPEFDSMAVVGLLTAIEERFGIEIADDEVDGSAFVSVGTLLEFLTAQLG